MHAWSKNRRYTTMGGLLLLLLLMMLAATACGNGEDKSGNAVPKGSNETNESTRLTNQGGTDTESTQGTNAGTSPSNQQADGIEQGASSGEPSNAQAEPRSYTHDFGTIEVPPQPERIVGIYLDDFLLALGVKPLTQTMYGQRHLAYLQDRVGDLPAISPGSINLELILEEQPELILLAYPFYAEEGRYDLFANIAPTYVFSGEDKWRQTLLTVADVIGRKEQADAWLDEYEQKVAAAREALKQAIGDETVMFIRFTRAERIQLYGGPSNFSADVLYGDLGLQPSALVKELAWDEENSAPLVSAEIIPQLDADHIFITYDNPANEDAQEFMNHPLWKNVPAVKAGNLHEVEMFHWMNDGPIANSIKVDDVLQALLEPAH